MFLFGVGSVFGPHVGAELNGTPACLHQRPAQPFVALPKQAPVEHMPAAGVSSGKHPAQAHSLAGEVNVRCSRSQWQSRC
jgi:hypothetical protein